MSESTPLPENESTPPAQVTPEAKPAKPPEKFGLKHILSLLFAIGITVAVFVFKDAIGNIQGVGYGVAFVTMLVTSATLIAPAPGLAFVYIWGSELNPLLLGLVAGAGSTLGELTGFLAGYSGSAVVENTDAYKRVEGYIQKYGLIPIVVLAAIPNPLFDAAGFVAGALGIKWWQFLIATFIGKAIKCIVVAYAGFYSFDMIEQWIR